VRILVSAGGCPECGDDLEAETHARQDAGTWIANDGDPVWCVDDACDFESSIEIDDSGDEPVAYVRSEPA